MEKKLLHVVSFQPGSEADVTAVLRHLRRLSPRRDALRCTLLLFCDLPAAPVQKTPQDEPLIQALLRGISSMNTHSANRFHLLVRSRVWNDAARAYLGAAQPLSCRRVIAQLLHQGITQAAFEAASLTPSSLKDRFSAVLFSDANLLCTPDTPARMYAALSASQEGMVGAQVLCSRGHPQSILSRLCVSGSFSLSPLRSAQKYHLALGGRCPIENPTLFTARALIHTQAASAPAAPDCMFIRTQPPTVRSMLLAYSALCQRQRSPWLLVPALQLLALFCGALAGLPLLTAAAFLPELWTLAHPSHWPGALLRTALLPLTALLSLDTLLCRLFARSPLLRLRIPCILVTPPGCVFLGGALLFAALSGVHALTVLLPIALLWLSAPLLLPALDKPTLERIPLDALELSRLRSLAESAFFDCEQDKTTSRALFLLAACAGGMLGLLEPDEATRRAQALMDDGLSCRTCADQVALLAGAQYLREHMPECDAALRPLPARLEALVLAQPPTDSGQLSALLHAMHSGAALQSNPPSGECAEAAGLLFLPLRPAKDMPQRALSLPLTHPHTYLRRQLLENADEQADLLREPTVHFLFLAAAALEHPFYALLLRSPIAGAYAAMLTV